MSALGITLPQDGIARTLTRDVTIALEPGSQRPLITDCGFEQANTAAEELYGCPLTHRYKSEFRRREDTLTAQCRYVASMQGGKDWNSDTCNYLIRADGEGVWVRQDVTTYHESDLTYWLTSLHVVSQPGVIATCNINEYNLTLAQLRAACGRFTIADIQDLPGNLTSALSLSKIIPDGLNICKLAGQSTVRIRLGVKFLRRFLHCCQACGLLWSSNVSKPKTCARRGQTLHDTSCGTKIWWRQSGAARE